MCFLYRLGEARVVRAVMEDAKKGCSVAQSSKSRSSGLWGRGRGEWSSMYYCRCPCYPLSLKPSQCLRSRDDERVHAAVREERRTGAPRGQLACLSMMTVPVSPPQPPVAESITPV